MKAAALFAALSALASVSAAPATASAAASEAAVTAAASAAVAKQVVKAPEAAFDTKDGAPAGPGGPLPGAPAAAQAEVKAQSAGDVIRVTADHLFGLNKGLFDGLLRDLAKPWFTNGKKEAMGDEEVQTWRPLAEMVA